MFRLKSSRVAIAMLCSLFLIGFIVQSDAASASLSVWADDDLGGGGSTQAWLTADEGIDSIDWYVKDGPDSDYEYEKTTMHNGATSAYEYLGTFTGDIKGKSMVSGQLCHLRNPLMKMLTTRSESVNPKPPLIMA